jgi:hypothetical protein
VTPVAACQSHRKVGRTAVAFLSAVDDQSASRTGSHPVFNIARIQRDLSTSARAALVYTDRADGGDSNRVLGFDSRVTFRRLYRLQAQAAVSRTDHGGEVSTAPLWDISLNRDGHRFGFLYSVRAVSDQFSAESGFLSRVGIATALLDHRVTFYGPRGSWLESLTSDVVLDGTWQYDDFVNGRGAQDQKLHFNNNAVLRGGWRLTGSVLTETFA